MLCSVDTWPCLHSSVPVCPVESIMLYSVDAGLYLDPGVPACLPCRISVQEQANYIINVAKDFSMQIWMGY